MAKKILALATMEAIFKKKANAQRVSNDAKEALRDVLEEIGENIAEKALKFANHSKRKTIKAADVRLAAKS